MNNYFSSFNPASDVNGQSTPSSMVLTNQTSKNEVDYTYCPQYNQSFLEHHKEAHFSGITRYIFNHSNNLQNTHEIQMLCSTIDSSHAPVNALLDDDSKYFKTGPAKKDQFIGVRFFCIKIRPSAICIKTTNFNFPQKNQILRSFIVVGKESANHQAVVIQEFGYTNKLKTMHNEIFYLNTDTYFDHIYIQQTSPSFDNERVFSILQFEIHGLIQEMPYTGSAASSARSSAKM